MPRILVVYFSRTGHTRRIAEEIAQRCGADVEGIEEPRSRRGFFGYFRSAREAYKKVAVEIRPLRHPPSSYDLVVLGTPVWAGHLSSPMRAFLRAHAADIASSAIFCTLGGAGADRTFAEMTELLARPPLASLAVTEGELKRSSYSEKLDELVKKLGSELRSPDPARASG
jgi:flavodoxin